VVLAGLGRVAIAGMALASQRKAEGGRSSQGRRWPIVTDFGVLDSRARGKPRAARDAPSW
jgi:hypothetical protein